MKSIRLLDSSTNFHHFSFRANEIGQHSFYYLKKKIYLYLFNSRANQNCQYFSSRSNQIYIFYSCKPNICLPFWFPCKANLYIFLDTHENKNFVYLFHLRANQICISFQMLIQTKHLSTVLVPVQTKLIFLFRCSCKPNLCRPFWFLCKPTLYFFLATHVNQTCSIVYQNDRILH